MTERLPRQTIEIRNRVADIAIAAMREAGIDPAKAVRSGNATLMQLTLEWRDGLMSREQFVHACRNLVILNPGLAAEKGTR